MSGGEGCCPRIETRRAEKNPEKRIGICHRREGQTSLAPMTFYPRYAGGRP